MTAVERVEVWFFAQIQIGVDYSHTRDSLQCDLVRLQPYKFIFSAASDEE